MLPDDETKEMPGRAAGGVARAASLTKERRQQIAQKAAVTRWQKGKGETVPVATHTGTLTIGGYDIDCANLDDGRRVLSQRGVNRALGRTHGGAEFKRRSEGGGELPIFLVGKALQPFISDELRAVVSNPILYGLRHLPCLWSVKHGLKHIVQRLSARRRKLRRSAPRRFSKPFKTSASLR
jgi:hypothetical protein